MEQAEWDDHFQLPANPNKERQLKKEPEPEPEQRQVSTPDTPVCNWGFDNAQEEDEEDQDHFTRTEIFKLYEQYLEDPKSISPFTYNLNKYSQDAQKELKRWFRDQGLLFDPNVNEEGDCYCCTLALTIDKTMLIITSDLRHTEEAAINESSLHACRLLDASKLLYPWQADKISQEEVEDRKRRINEANKEDDIEFDRTARPSSSSSSSSSSKRHCQLDSRDTYRESGLASSAHTSHADSKKPPVNTYESLMKRWNELNMLILTSKANLVKLDLSVASKPDKDRLTQLKRQSSAASSESRGTDAHGDAKSDANSERKYPFTTSEDNEDDELEIDPLDAFMSNLERPKSKFTMEDKIEKSRLKTQITAYQREQNDLSKLIEIAKPSGRF